MKYRRLGHSQIEVSELAFGAWGIGGRTEGATSYGVTDDKVSLRAVDRAYARGITFFDTSNVYGDGHSEVLLGQAFKSKRDRVAIATKAGWTSYAGPADFSPEGIRRSLEGSLRRLQSDYVDLLQLHNPPADWLHGHPEIMETLQNLVAEGKVLAVGTSVRAPEEAEPLIGSATATIQANFNLMDIRVLSNNLIRGFESGGQSLLARTPLCFGYLTGTIDGATLFTEGDHRNAWSLEQRQKWSDGAKLFADLIRQYIEGPLYEAALRFCLSFPTVGTVLSGILTEEEVDKNAAAVEKGPLPSELIDAIVDVHSRFSFFVARPRSGPGASRLAKT